VSSEGRGVGVGAPGGSVSNGGGVTAGVFEGVGDVDGVGVGRGVGRGVGSGVGSGVGNGVAIGGRGVGVGRGAGRGVGSGSGDAAAGTDDVANALALGEGLGPIDSLGLAESIGLLDAPAVGPVDDPDAPGPTLGLADGTTAVSAVGAGDGAVLPSSIRPVTTCCDGDGAISSTNAATRTRAIATYRGPRSLPPRGVVGPRRTGRATAAGTPARFGCDLSSDAPTLHPARILPPPPGTSW
jgi:hypothetical protein